jgi:hypothetical protein
MLSQILSKSTCAACQLCCLFDASDIWELPVLPPETVAAVKRQQPDVAFVPVETEVTFAAPVLKDEELFACPMLKADGCSLPEAEKPFDCKIWPFRLMRTADGSGIGIAISTLCEGIESHETAALQDFLQQNLAETCFAYAAQHPAHIKPWMDGYRMILPLRAIEK